MLLSRRRFVQLAAAGVAAGAAYKYDHIVNAFSSKIRPTRPVVKYTPEELGKLRISFHNLYRDFTKFFPHSMDALYNGMKSRGYNVFYAKYDQPAESDMAVVSGWYQNKVLLDCQRKNKNVLVVEPSYLQPRWEWPSVSFNGLAGYGIFPEAPQDNGERFNQYFGHLLKPWQERAKGYVLLLGQVPNDRSLYGLNMNEWLQQTTNELLLRGEEVVFRPHPWVAKGRPRYKKMYFAPAGARLSTGTLEEDMNGARYSVMYSSTAAVESVLAGVPAVVMCKGSIAWDVTSHDLDNPIFMPDRTKWCHDLAWKQWQISELEDGSAWEHVRRAILV